jgi:hypothetical protein
MSQSFRQAQPSGIQKLISPPDQPTLPAAPEETEDVTTLTDDSARAQRRKKRVGIRGGKQSTIKFGIQAALTKRLLGE